MTGGSLIGGENVWQDALIRLEGAIDRNGNGLLDTVTGAAVTRDQAELFDTSE